MKETKGTTEKQNLFARENYILMLVGLALLTIGFFMMAGGRSANPNEFNPKEIYSTGRITIAPILIVAGFIVEVIAIMKKSKAN